MDTAHGVDIVRQVGGDASRNRVLVFKQARVAAGQRNRSA